jgi:omega-6 fatty acid desaturase (delta-12 desaturase)
MDNNTQNTIPDTKPEARQWVKILAPYQKPSNARSIFEIALTASLFVLCWIAMWWSLDVSYWITFALMLPAAGFLVRLFLIQHDCGHGAFFKKRSVNDWVGRVLGIFTLTPYDFWKRTHAIHHAGSGNLDRRGLGDIDTLTVREYEALSPRKKFMYRVYRSPFVLFLLGPTYQFFLQHRLPIGLMRRGWTPWVSTMSTNVGILIFAGLVMWFAGVKELLIIQIPVTVLATSIGVWLFYVQHQFDETHWDHEENWNRHEAALHGSSHYDLPPILAWFTANIGIHHVHHLCSAIPFYRLNAVLREHPELGGVGRITLWESIRCIPLCLWDEDSRRLISFRDFRKLAAA